MQTISTVDALDRVGTALADPTRRRILLALLDGPTWRQVRYELASPRLGHALSDLVDLELEIDSHHRDLDGRG